MPGCTVGFEHCRIHHVTYWEHNGRTDLDNLVPICERHHHLVHEGGWTLHLHPGRRITVQQPDGTTSFDGVTTNRWQTTIDIDADPPSRTRAGTRDATCQPKRPPPTTAIEIAEELQLALHELGANAP